MKIILSLLLILAPFVNFAQSFFEIKGYGKGYKDGDVIFLSYRGPNGFIDDSVKVIRNSFQFSGNIEIPVKASLYRNQNPLHSNVIYDYATLFIEPGVAILTSPDTLLNSVNSGTPLNTDYTELVSDLRPLLNQRRSMKSPSDLNEKELKDSALVKKITRAWQSNSNEMVPIKFKFVEQHLKSLVSLDLLNELIRDSRWHGKVDSLFTKLSPELQISVLGKLVNERIQLGKKVIIGSLAKNFELSNEAGQSIKLSDYKGQYILLDFWASWCGPCRAENPNLRSAYLKFKDRGLSIISVSIDEVKDQDKWKAAIKQDKMDWTQVIDVSGKGNVAKSIYGITTIPANLLISPEGIVIAKDLKRDELHSKLVDLLK